MIPRINLHVDDSDGIDSEFPAPTRRKVFRETFCNPEVNNCSPVCCCFGFLTIQRAVNGVTLISLGFVLWELIMGSWLLMGAYNVIESEDVQQDSIVNITQIDRQTFKLIRIGWFIIGSATFRLTGVVYLLWILIQENKNPKLGTALCTFTTTIACLLLFLPIFSKIPGQIYGDKLYLNHFKPIFITVHVIDSLFMLCYSLYVVLYYVIYCEWLMQKRQRSTTDNLLRQD